jgi:PAS domain-containing protein
MDQACMPGGPRDPDRDVSRTNMDRRRNRPPETAEEFLQQLPARLLVERLSTPTLVIGLDSGVVQFANPACAELLGFPNEVALQGQSLPQLLAGQTDAIPGDCLALLRTKDAVVKWQHADGYPVSTVVSNTICLRATDPLLVLNLTDVTALVWLGVNTQARARKQP